MAGNLTLPRGHCGGDDRTRMQVKLMVTGVSDGVDDNNLITLQYPCATGRCNGVNAPLFV